MVSPSRSLGLLEWIRTEWSLTERQADFIITTASKIAVDKDGIEIVTVEEIYDLAIRVNEDKNNEPNDPSFIASSFLSLLRHEAIKKRPDSPDSVIAIDDPAILRETLHQVTPYTAEPTTSRDIFRLQRDYAYPAKIREAIIAKARQTVQCNCLICLGWYNANIDACPVCSELGHYQEKDIASVFEQMREQLYLLITEVHAIHTFLAEEANSRKSDVDILQSQLTRAETGLRAYILNVQQQVLKQPFVKPSPTATESDLPVDTSKIQPAKPITPTFRGATL